jgi:hypothetical protein
MSEQGAREWLERMVIFFGLGFHWDTRGAEYTALPGLSAADYDAQAELAFGALALAGHDPYQLAHEVMKQWHGAMSPRRTRTRRK